VPRALHALEVTVPEGDGYWPQRLKVQARAPGGAWVDVGGAAIRPQRTALQRPPHGQLWVLPAPITAGALRIARGDGRAWAISEVRLSGPPGESR
jgi:hypothetical protein